MTTPNVAFIRKELKQVLPQYNLIRDCLLGESAIKAAREKYLPKPSEKDSDAKRYESYLERAVFYNLTRHTLNQLVALAFRENAEIILPVEMESMIDNVDGSFNTFEQQCKKAVSLTIAYSRCGLLIDFPETEGFIPVSEKDSYKPTIKAFSPFNIINWNTRIVNGNEILSQVVLTEPFTFYDDGFERKQAAMIRALNLDSDGNCYYEIYCEEDPKLWDGRKEVKGIFKKIRDGYLTDYKGNFLKFIPFTFIGTVNNDFSIDSPSFYDIASLNISHYRNSADYEEGIFVAGQPTVVITGVNNEWVNNNMDGTINLGVRGGIPLPVGGDAKLIQAQSNNTAKEAMELKEKQMIALGARLTEVNKNKQTATQAEIDNINESSVLASVVNNVQAAYMWAFKTAALFVNANADKIQIDLSKSIKNFTEKD